MCRSRRELSNPYLLAKFGFDTAENEPCKVSLRGHPRSAGERLWGLIVAPGTERGAEVSAQIVVESRSLLPPEKLQEEVDLRRLFLASLFFCFFYVLFLLQIISRKIVDKRSILLRFSLYLS